MTKHFKDYVWIEGLPYGIGHVEENDLPKAKTYKIVMDPYRKRVSIEKYVNSEFSDIVYDSALVNFRHLKPAEQTGWQKFNIDETPNEVVSILRNQDDRIVAIETYHFKNNLCVACHSKSPHGIAVSYHKMYYTKLGDPFNGVILFDQNDHPVMFKRYEVSEEDGEFTKLIEEQWDMEKKPLPTAHLQSPVQPST